MKTALKLCIVVLLLLFALTACDLYNGINVGWNIDYVTAGPLVQVGYTVWNQGMYDLTGVNLEIGVEVNLPPLAYISAWTTPDFNLAQNETRSGSITINATGYTITGVAAVLGVDMDSPND